MKNRKSKGFTLTELLTTIATIGVLGSLLLPAITKAKHRARDTQCLNNMRDIKMGLESAYTDVIPDYNWRDNHQDIEDFAKIFIRNHVPPFIRDDSFGNLEVYTSQPLTCPYALGSSTTRTPFRIASMVEFPEAAQNPAFRGVSYFTYTYTLSIDFLRVDTKRDTSQELAVIDTPNFGKQETVMLGDLIHGIDKDQEKPRGIDRNKTYIFDSSRIHPHKGYGVWVTFGSGEQRWIRVEDR